MHTHEQQVEWLLHKLIKIMVRMEEQLQQLNKRSHYIMATLQEVKDEIEALKTRVSDEVAEVASKVQALIDEIEALKDGGTVVTPEQLDELVTSLKSIGEAVEAISGAETPPVEPPVDPTDPFAGR